MALHRSSNEVLARSQLFLPSVRPMPLGIDARTCPTTITMWATLLVYDFTLDQAAGRAVTCRVGTRDPITLHGDAPVLVLVDKCWAHYVERYRLKPDLSHELERFLCEANGRCWQSGGWSEADTWRTQTPLHVWKTVWKTSGLF